MMHLSEDNEVRFDDLIYSLRTAIRETRDDLGHYKDWTHSQRKRVDALQGLDRWLVAHQHEANKICEWMGR